MRRIAAFLSVSLGLSVLCAACVSAPEIRSLPKIEGRFGAPAPPKKEKAPVKTIPPPKAPNEAEKTVDPPPHRTRDFVKFSFLFESGHASWVASERVQLEEETAAARRFGRFALVALKDGALIERVHFDFPLLAKTNSGSDRLEQGLTTKTSVLFPDLEDDAELFLIDEKTGAKQAVPWRTLPTEPKAPVPTSSSTQKTPPRALGPAADPSAGTQGAGSNEKQ